MVDNIQTVALTRHTQRMREQTARASPMYGSLLASHDTEQLRAAVRANTLGGGTTVLPGHFLRLGNFFLRFALHTIRF
jgi:hypothetical protein